MRNRFFTIIATLLAAPGLVSAQGSEALSRPGILLPGTLSISAGTIAPTEPGNVIGSAAAEQGFTVWNRGPVFVSGFVMVATRYDSEGLAWNRATAGTGGVKLVAVTRAGILQVAAGMSAHTAAGQPRRDSLAAYASYWSGWHGRPSSPARLLPKSYPGYASAFTGRVTAAEPDNWITQASVQQGATVLRAFGVAAVPFVGGAASADTSRYAWNNRTHAEGGLKLVRSLGSGAVIEGGIAHRYEHARLTGSGRDGAVAFVNAWFGWSPRLHAR